MNNVIYFKPAVQFENTGDLMINKIALNFLRSYGQVVVDDSNSPDWFIEQISIPEKDLLLTDISNDSINKNLLRSLIKRRIRFGSDLQYYYVIHPGHTSRRGFKAAFSSFRKGVKLLILKVLGLRVLRVGFSIGPFDKYNSWSESFLSQLHHYYGVRDNQSLAIAKKSYFRKPEYFPDFAWAHIPEILNKNQDTGDYIVISFRSNSYGVIHSQEYLNPIINRLKRILSDKKFFSLKIVVSYQVKYDRSPAKSIYEALSGQFNVQFLDKKVTLKEAECLYAKAKFVLSNRLHVILLALQCKTLAFPLVNRIDNRKITSILNDNSLGHIVLDLNESSDSNMKSIDEVMQRKMKVLIDYGRNSERNQREIKRKLDSIFL